MEAVGPHITNGVFDMPVMWTKYFGQEGSFIIRADIPSTTLWKNRIWKLQDARCSGRQNSDEVKRNEKVKVGVVGCGNISDIC